MERAIYKTILTLLRWKDITSSSMYDDWVINSIDEFKSLDDESVRNFCKVLRLYVGVTSNGAPDPGVKVNARSESNFMFAVLFIKHEDRVSRDITFRNVPFAGVMKFSNQLEMDKYDMEGSVITPRVNTNDWLKMLELVEEYLRKLRGLNVTPLSYVVRKQLVPMSEA